MSSKLSWILSHKAVGSIRSTSSQRGLGNLDARYDLKRTAWTHKQRSEDPEGPCEGQSPLEGIHRSVLRIL